jgi:zinc protease
VKKYFLSLLLILSFLIGTSPGQGKPSRGQTPPVPAATPQAAYEIPIVTKVLANGLEVIVLPDSSVPIATVELDVRNGSFTEPPELNGLSHLFEHMFFKPNLAVRLMQCDNTTAAERLSPVFNSICGDAIRMRTQIGDTSYLRDSDQLGFYNGSTKEEVVNYFYNVTSPYLAAAIRQINDSVRFPNFDEKEFDN